VTEIAEALATVRHPETGERVMSAPLRPREVYAGPRLDDAPHLLAVPRDYRWEILSDFTPYGPIADRGRDGVFGPALRQATHRLHGIIAMNGRGLRDRFRLSGARIEDVTPTVLHLLGQEVPSYMRGRVLTEALDVRGDRAPVRREMAPDDAGVSGDYTDSEAAAVERDLHGLGYV
jgi:predicted AlkP superfamily phosphohydrolase/phosphomutase